MVELCKWYRVDLLCLWGSLGLLLGKLSRMLKGPKGILKVYVYEVDVIICESTGFKRRLIICICLVVFFVVLVFLTKV